MKASDLKPNEYAEYYSPYVKQSGNANLLDVLKESAQALNSLFETISDEKMNYKYGRFLPCF